MELIKIEFKVSDENFGTPNPPIEDGDIVILIQDEEVTFEVYCKANTEEPYPSFYDPFGPSSNTELKKSIIDEIKRQHPDYLNSQDSVVLKCPEEIASKLTDYLSPQPEED